MVLDVRDQPKARNRTVVLAAGASLLLVLFVAGLAFANSIGAAKVASNASSLHWANATLGTSSLARAALVQAISFACLEDDGLVNDEDRAFATDQVNAAYAELRDLEAHGASSQSIAFLTHFLAPLEASMRSLEAGNVEASQATL